MTEDIQNTNTLDPAITPRFATLDDLEFIRWIRDGHLPVDTLKRKIEAQEAVVAERGGERVGYLRLEYLWSEIPYIGMIRVLDEHRRQGVGRALLQFVETFLQGRGHAALYSSSQVDEPPPQAWHRHMGFEECGIIAGINRGGIGEVFFRKRLG